MARSVIPIILPCNIDYHETLGLKVSPCKRSELTFTQNAYHIHLVKALVLCSFLVSP